MLKRVLVRRAANRMKVRHLDEATAQLIEASMDDLTSLGFLNDDAYAATRVASLKQKGMSKRRVSVMMQAKGLARETIAVAIGDELDDLAQARRFAEKKRLGPWRPAGKATAADSDSPKKDLLVLQRAGFPYAIAKSVLSGK